MVQISSQGQAIAVRDSVRSGPSVERELGVTLRAAALLLLLACAGCGPGSTPAPSPTSATIGGTLTGLASGTSLTLSDNGNDSLTVSSNGAFTFAKPVTAGAGYQVVVQTQPTDQICTISNGSGANVYAPVDSVNVVCILNYPDVVLHSFGTSADGAVPSAALLLTSDGTIYGTTAEGGTSDLSACRVGGCGTIFKIAPDGTYSVIYSFGAGPDDGQVPQSALIQGSDGNLYGTTNQGGASAASDGTVFKISPGGAYSVLYSFGSSSNDGALPGSGVVQGADGNFYGTTAVGGAFPASCSGIGCGTVFELTPQGQETVLYSFGGNDIDGEMPQASLLLASDGNFYGTTPWGGAYKGGTVFKISPSGTYTLVYSFGATANDATNPLVPLIEGADGNFYGTTYLGGAATCTGPPSDGVPAAPGACGAVFRITPTGAESVIYSFGSTSTDGFRPQSALVLGADGNFYGTTELGGLYGNGTVFRITASGTETVLYSFAGSPADGAFPAAPLIEGSGGKFYGTTLAGGSETACGPDPGCGTVYGLTFSP